MNNTAYDVVIIGGSYSGLSAALALGRSLRRVLVIDAGQPCNAQTPHSHNFLTQDGQTPQALASLAREQVSKYPTVTFVKDLALSAIKQPDNFVVNTESGKTFRATKLLLATGIKDIMPDINGFSECWGISVLHCPYCHGYEVSNTRLGILANGDMAVELVKLIYNWSKDLTLFTNGPSALTPEQTQEVQRYTEKIFVQPIASIDHEKGKLSSITLGDATRISLDAAFTRILFTHHTDIARQLDCAFTEAGHIAVDDLGKTNIEGVYASGDCTIQMRSVSLAVANGFKAAAAINKELLV